MAEAIGRASIMSMQSLGGSPCHRYIGKMEQVCEDRDG